MSTIALELIAAMLRLGDLGPIHRGEFRREHCTDAGSESLFDFLARYRQITDGNGHVPAMSVVHDRFPHIMLPETAATIDLDALVYEARNYKVKMQIQSLSDALVGAIDAADPITELRRVRQEFDEIMKGAASSRDLSFAEAAMEILDDYSAKNILKKGVPWPWETMTAATQGLHGGEFYIIAGRPKSRKTFVALYVAAFLVKHFKLRVLFISPEMGNRQVMIRFMAFLGVVPYAPFKSGELSPEDEDRLFQTIAEVRDVQLGLISPEFDLDHRDGSFEIPDDGIAANALGAFIVTKASGQPVGFVEAKIKEHRPHVVIVDSFYRLGVTGGKSYDADWKVITTVSRNLKDIAMEHDVVVLGTHQLNREADDKVGGLANLGYSDAIGQDCDMAIRVITAKRSTGDKSALVILGARETPIDGVIIHNEPCNNFSEIEPITPANKKKLLTMLCDEDQEAKMEEQEQAARAPGAGAPPNAKRGYVRAGGPTRAPAVPANTGIIQTITPEDLKG